MKLTLAQEKALRLVAAGRHDCETTATKVTRLLRTKGLLAFGEVDGRVAYVLTEAGRKQLGGSDAGERQMRKQTWQQWVRAVERDPHTLSRIRKGALSALTGTDHRVLNAFVACLELYAYDNSSTVLTAARTILARMQSSTRWIAKELIAFVFEWHDRERLWPFVEPYKVTLPSNSTAPREAWIVQWFSTRDALNGTASFDTRAEAQEYADEKNTPEFIVVGPQRATCELNDTARMLEGESE